MVLASPIITDALHPAELAALDRAERTIARGLKTFVEVGQALIEIRDARLYRATHSNFEDYCTDRWGLSKTHGNRLIQAYEVTRILTPTGVTPANEAQARELAPLLDDPDRCRDAWSQIITNGKPTAAAVRAVVREQVPAEPKPEARRPEPVEPAPARVAEPKPAALPEQLALELEHLRARSPEDVAAACARPADVLGMLDEIAAVRAWCDQVAAALLGSEPGARPHPADNRPA